MVGAGTYTLRNRLRHADPMPPEEHEVIRWCLMTHSPICHSTMLVRLAALRDAGLAYDRSFDFGDDYDLYHRMAAVGRLAMLSERLVAYRLHGKNASVLKTSDMNARGAVMLARAHETHLGLRMEPQTFSALWHVIASFQPARSLEELVLVERGLTALLERYEQVTHLSDAAADRVRRAASRQWWDAVNRSAATLGTRALAQFDRTQTLHAYRPPAMVRIRNRLGRALRTAFPALIR
jgi:hypothetical protein